MGVGCPSFGTKTSSSTDGGVFKSTDAGKTWVQTSVVPTAKGIGTLATSDILSMTMDPKDNAFVYIGTLGNGLLTSDDSGASWRIPRQAPLRDGTISAIAVDPNDSCTMYTAKNERLYKSANCMRSFDDEVYVETRSGVSIAKIAVDWYSKGVVFIGLSNGDVLKSNDFGKSWRTVLKTNKEVTEILLNNKDSRQVMVSSSGVGVQRTTDGGENWVKVAMPSALKGVDSVFSMTQTLDSSAVLATAKYGLLRSYDFGSTWEAIKLLTSPGQVSIYAAGMGLSDPNTIYYATPSTFYKSSDGGQTWQTQKFPSKRIPSDLLVDPKDQAVLYVGVRKLSEK